MRLNFSITLIIPTLPQNAINFQSTAIKQVILGVSVICFLVSTSTISVCAKTMTMCNNRCSVAMLTLLAFYQLRWLFIRVFVSGFFWRRYHIVAPVLYAPLPLKIVVLQMARKWIGEGFLQLEERIRDYITDWRVLCLKSVYRRQCLQKRQITQTALYDQPLVYWGGGLMLRWWCERPRCFKEQEWLYVSSNVNTYRKEFSVRFPRRYTRSLISKVPISSNLTNLYIFFQFVKFMENSWKFTCSAIFCHLPCISFSL
eukprot:476855_1